MKTFKKILCTLLVVVMCLTSAPLQGFVGIELPDFSEWFGSKVSALEASGSCGENVTYTYNSATGELIISGVGAMTDYYGSEGSPFNNSFVKNVIFENGVTSIGACAFYKCTSLISIMEK